MITNYFIIAIIVVYIVDYSGFINELKYGLSKWLTNGKIQTDNYSLKPLDCSLCATFWIAIAYTLYVGISFKTLLFCVIASYSTSYIADMMYIIKDLWTKLTSKI